MIRRTWHWFLYAVGLLSLITGIIGIFVPLLPTTPFVLLSFSCFSVSSPRLQSWMWNHPVMGPAIRDWRTHRVIRLRAKVLATVMILASFSFPLFLVRAVPFAVKPFLGAMATGLLLFIWTRLSRPRESA